MRHYTTNADASQRYITYLRVHVPFQLDNTLLTYCVAVHIHEDEEKEEILTQYVYLCVLFRLQ